MQHVKMGVLLCFAIVMLGEHTPQLRSSAMAYRPAGIQSQSPLLLQVDEQGNIILDGEALGAPQTSELKEKLRAKLRDRAMRAIVVKPQASLSYDKLADILGLARGIGASEIRVLGLSAETTAYVPELGGGSGVLPMAGINIDPVLYRDLPNDGIGDSRVKVEPPSRKKASAQQALPKKSPAPQVRQPQPEMQNWITTLRVDIFKDGVIELLHDKGGQFGADTGGTTDDTGKLSSMLKDILSQRSRDKRTVFIKPYATLPFGDVARIMEAIHAAGGDPIGLQIDALEGTPLIVVVQPPPMCGSGDVLFPEADVTGPRRGKGSGGKRVEANRAFSPKEVAEKARIVSRPEPAYTEDAKKNQFSGTVVLRGIVSPKGQLTSICVVGGLPFGLTEAAIDASRLIKFTPAMKDGHPVAQYLQVEYNFILD